MITQRYGFIHSFFAFLQKEEYLLLKWWGQDLSTLAEETDLDLLIRPTSLPLVEAFIKESKIIKGFQKETQIGVCHYSIFFKDGTFLQIDLLTQFIRKNIVYLKTAEVFKTTRLINGIKTYSLGKLFEHVLLFNFLNGSGLPQKYKQLFKSLPLTKQTQLLDFFNTKYQTSFQSLPKYSYNTTKKIIKKHILRYKENRLKNRVLHGFKLVNLLWRSLKVKPGEIITFSGVDGAGKSTILQDTLNLLEGKFRQQVVVLRHRPSLLPILSAWKYGKAQAEQRSVNQLPRQGNNSNILSSSIRFFYYYVDYLIGQIYIWAKYVLRGKIVLYDRYYYDFIVDSKRSNLQLPSFFPKSLFAFIQKPKLNFFLYADAQTILSRKKELSAQEINNLTIAYQSLFQEFSKKYKGNYIPIENKEKPQTLAIIEKYLVQQFLVNCVD